MAKIKYEYVKEYFESFGYKLISKDYVGTFHKLNTECPKGHSYEVSFSSFKNGSRCRTCNTLRKRTSEEDIRKMVEARGYTFIKRETVNNRTRITVTCDRNHTYTTSLQSFKEGKKCRKCSGSNKNTYEYVYNYFLSEGYILLSTTYKNNKEKLKVMCPKGHIFYMKFNHFSTGTRCSRCRESKGVKRITNFFNLNNIFFEKEYRFEDCRLEKPLPFDFYLPEYNICIEYDGELHFKAVDFFGGEEHLEITKVRDAIKTKYCEDNNIKLIRIPYWDFDNIERILHIEIPRRITFND